MTIKSHRDLELWKKAVSLAADVYEVTRQFPREEQYGFASQMNRAVVSIPANNAEGAARGSKKEFRRFLLIARGSLSELETLVVIARQIRMLNDPQAAGLASRVDHVSALLDGLLRSLPSR